MHKHGVIIACILLTLGVGSTHAQEPITQTDFDQISTIVSASQNDPYAFLFDLAATGSLPNGSLALQVNGQGQVAPNNGGFSVAGNGQLTINGVVTPFALEMRVLDQWIYTQLVNPQSGADTGWLAFNVADASYISAQSAALLIRGVAGNLAAQIGITVDPSAITDENAQRLGQAVRGMQVLPLLGVARLAPTPPTQSYLYRLEVPALVASPSFLALMNVLINDIGVSMGLPPANADELGLLTNGLAGALQGSVVNIQQTLNNDVGRVGASSAAVTLTLPATLVSPENTQPPTLNATLNVQLGNYGQAVSILPPDSPRVVTRSLFQYAFTGQADPIPTPTRVIPVVVLPPASGSLAVGQVVQGTLQSNQTLVFDVPVEANQTLSIFARRLADAPADLDLRLTLYNPEGQQLATNDDHGSAAPGLGRTDAALIDVTFQRAGVFKVSVSAWFGVSGGYEVGVAVRP